MNRTREQIEASLYGHSLRGARADMPRSVAAIHTLQRQQTSTALEACVRETQEYYNCTPGVALRIIESQVVAFERAAGREEPLIVRDADGVSKPYATALARAAAVRR